jgi:hypothetical protein
LTAIVSAAMSVVVVVPDTFETVRKTLDHLKAQSVQAQLELIFVAPSRQSVCLPYEELLGFAGVCLVEIDAIHSAGQAKAQGIQRASAPIVAFAEDHSYPEPGWAQALIKSYVESTVAVAPVLVNSNPDSAVSWASLYLDFGPTIEPAAGGHVERLPWHNTTYRRDVLLTYGPELAAMLDVEGILLADLKSKGYTLWLECKSRTRHLNVALVSSLVREQFYGGRLFAASQAQHYHWSWWQRFGRVVGAPIVPLVRLSRTVRDIDRSGRRRLLPRLLPLLILGLAVHASGELIGCALGMGDALQQRYVLEFHRERHLAGGNEAPV